MIKILNKYGIVFHKKIDKNPITGFDEIEPIMDTLIDENFILIRFFSDYYRESDIQDYVLNVIQNVLENKSTEEQTSSQSGVNVWISSNTSKFVNFYGSGSYLDPDLIIPQKILNNLRPSGKNLLQQGKFFRK